jgi:glycosyltransferase involved in cell wall biosynthesis
MVKIMTFSSSYPRFEGDIIAPFIEHISREIVANHNEINMILPYHPEFKRKDEHRLQFHLYKYKGSETKAIWGYASSMKADVRLKTRAIFLVPSVYREAMSTGQSFLEEFYFDAIHAHWLLPNGFFAMHLAREYNLPLAVSLHGSDVTISERPLFRPLAKRILERAGWISACSEDLRIRAIELGCDPDKIVTIPYGVDVNRFLPDTRKKQHLRDKLGPKYRHGDRIILAVGRLVDKKGFTYLIDAMKIILARNLKVFLIIVGEGDLRASLEKQAKVWGIANKILFTGKIERDELPLYFSGCDVFAVPSIRDRLGNVDGLPNVLMEGLASGCAIVASEIAGIPNVISDGVNGLLVPPADSRSLADTILRVIENDKLRKSLGSEARKIAVNNYTWKHTGKRYSDGLVSLVKEGRL